MARTVTLRLEKDAYEELREAAAAERRPSNFIAAAALERVREAQFVDDGEMAEILNNERCCRTSLRPPPWNGSGRRSSSTTGKWPRF